MDFYIFEINNNFKVIEKNIVFFIEIYNVFKWLSCVCVCVVEYRVVREEEIGRDRGWRLFG